MSGYCEYLGVPCPAEMISQTACSFVNDVISIQFSTGTLDNETLKQNYDGLDLDKQQFYIFRPSDIFEKSVDSIVSKSSWGYGNLQCSYELFDECLTSKGLADGCFTTSESFACKYDAKKVKDGFLESDDHVPLYGFKMPLEYHNYSYYDKATFSHIFHVGNNPGTYCVNVTTFEAFDKPVIRFWDRTPVSKKIPRLSLPNIVYIFWLVIASVVLFIFTACNELDSQSEEKMLLVIVCLSKNFFDALSFIFQAKDWLVLHIIVTGLFGTFATFSAPHDELIKKVKEKKKKMFAAVLTNFLVVKGFYYIIMCVQRFSRPFGFFALGSIMNDLVIFKYNGQILFFITFLIPFFAISGSASKAAESEEVDSRRAEKPMISIAFVYYLTCCFVELFFFTRKSQFLDTFYKDPLVIFYSRLDEIFVIVYICGAESLKKSCEGHQYMTSDQYTSLPLTDKHET